MTDIVSPAAGAAAVNKATRRDIGIKRRYAAERRFRAYGLAAISFGLIFLFLLLWSVVSKGHTAFQQTMITVPVEFSELIIDPKNERATNPAKLMTANYPSSPVMQWPRFSASRRRIRPVFAPSTS